MIIELLSTVDKKNDHRDFEVAVRKKLALLNKISLEPRRRNSIL